MDLSAATAPPPVRAMRRSRALTGREGTDGERISVEAEAFVPSRRRVIHRGDLPVANANLLGMSKLPASCQYGRLSFRACSTAGVSRPENVVIRTASDQTILRCVAPVVQ